MTPDWTHLFNLGLLLVLGMSVLKFLEYGIGYFFKRITKDDYLTKKHCDQCKMERKDNDNDFRREVREKLGIITGALVVMAAGKEVSLEEIQKLLTAGIPK